LAAGISWAAEPSPVTSHAPSPQPSNSVSPRLTPLALASLLSKHTQTLASESTVLALESAALSNELDSDREQLLSLQIEANELKLSRDSFATSLATSNEASEKAAYTATEAIEAAGLALARMTRSRNRWRSTAFSLAGGAVVAGVTAWVISQ
jgi:hypothetical protein